jgi:hypothetical protein
MTGGADGPSHSTKSAYTALFRTLAIALVLKAWRKLQRDDPKGNARGQQLCRLEVDYGKYEYFWCETHSCPRPRHRDSVLIQESLY